MPNRTRSPLPAGPTRRRWLVGGAALAGAWAAGLAGCGGGGGGGGGNGDGAGPAPDDGGGGGGGGGDRPPGRLVYRNRSMAAIRRFDTGAALAFDPGIGAFVQPGMAVAPDGTVLSALEGDNASFEFGRFDLDGRRLGTLTVRRPFSFLTSAPSFDAAGDRMAFSVDEPVSETDDERIARSFVVRWPDGALLASLDRHEGPVFGGDTLVVRDPATLRLHRADAALRLIGAPLPFEVETSAGSYDLSPDGRWLLWSRANEIRVHEIDTGRDWLAAERRISNLEYPKVSPDGRWLAMMTIDQRSATVDFTTYVPHVVPLQAGRTVTVDSAVHALETPIVECAGRMGWWA